MYGRKVDIVPREGNGPPEDHTAAIADATKIMQRDQAVRGDRRTVPGARVLAADREGAHPVHRDVLRRRTARRTSTPNAPYVWPVRSRRNSTDDLTAEMIGKQLAGKDASYAGDASMHTKPARLGLHPGPDRPRAVQRDATQRFFTRIQEQVRRHDQGAVDVHVRRVAGAGHRPHHRQQDEGCRRDEHHRLGRPA